MAFYIISKGKLSLIDFEYLTNPGGSRIDKTVVPEERTSRDLLKELKQQQAKETYAIEIMSKPVETLPFDALAEDALKTFEQKNFHHLVLTEGDLVKGLISSKDLAFLTSLELEGMAMASQFMSKMILACNEETPIDHLARVMVNEKISAIPVVDGSEFLTGIVTHHDLLRWIFE